MNETATEADAGAPTENVNACPLCHSPLHVTEFRQPPYEIRRCAACGLVFVTPRRPRGAARRRDDDPSLTRRDVDKRLEFALLNGPAGGRALDFGPSTGPGVAALSARGFDAHGIAGALTDQFLDAAGFDLITMWDVVARVPNPATLLRDARGLLAPGGRLVIATGDVDSRAARWQGRRWRQFAPAEHLVHFNRSTMLRLLGETGFELERVTHAPSRLRDEMVLVALRRARRLPR